MSGSFCTVCRTRISSGSRCSRHRTRSPSSRNASSSLWVREIRPRALARADFKCERCGARAVLDVHHKDGNPSHNAAANLVVLCHDCHVEAHRQEIHAKPLRRPESRSLPPAENQLPLVAAYTTSTVTPTAALAIADVWAAVRVLADAASSLPIHIYRKTPSGREQVTSGKLYDLLEQPGPATSQADLVSSLMAHLAIYGSGYIAKFRSAGEIVQLGLVHPERIRPELDQGRLRFRYSPNTGPQQLLTTADVVFVRGLSLDGLTGLSAVSQAGRVLGLSDELVKHAGVFGVERTSAGCRIMP